MFSFATGHMQPNVLILRCLFADAHQAFKQTYLLALQYCDLQAIIRENRFPFLERVLAFWDKYHDSA